MSILVEERLNLFLVNDLLWMVTKPTGTAIYDFQLEHYFRCEHKWQLPSSILAVARVGARHDYAAFYDALQQSGVRLIHSRSEHDRCSELPHWYPLISDLTPRSRWFSAMPDLELIQQEFDWPIFIKGARQTSKHQKSLSIIEGPEAFLQVQQQYAQDPILHWQDIVCREYVPLRLVKGGSEETIPPAFEFRTFWWKGTCVGAGRYWFDVPEYNWTTHEREQAMTIAREAALRVDVPFLVIDIAQRADGHWIVIECNDGQESGYAAVSPFALWKNILTVESKQSTDTTE